MNQQTRPQAPRGQAAGWQAPDSQRSGWQEPGWQESGWQESGWRLPAPPAGSALALCPDGVCRWTCEFPMYRNPAILFAVWKVMGLACALVWIFTAGISLFDHGFDAQAQLQLAGVFLPGFAGAGIVLGAAAALAGAARGSWSAAGAGLLAAADSTRYTEFARVRSGRAARKRSTICLNGLLQRNQIYAGPQDFDFVLSFIRSRVPARAAASLEG